MHRPVHSTSRLHRLARQACRLAVPLLAAFAAAVPPAHSAEPLHGQAPPVRIALAGERLPGLFDQHARSFGAERVAGKWTLLTFGFTQCSSTCPASLLQGQQIAAALGAAVQIVFVTLDPVSDTPARLGQFLGQVHPRIVGVTGNPRAIEGLVDRFRVGVRAGSAGALEHSSYWYLIGPQGEVVRIYRLATPVGRMIEDLRNITGETSQRTPVPGSSS